MYIIRKTDGLSSTKILLNRVASLGLGFAALQFYVELGKIFQFVRLSEDNKENIGPIWHPLIHKHGTQYKCGEENLCIPFEKISAPNIQGDLKRYFAIGVLIYAQIFIGIIDVFLFTVVRIAIRKESISDSLLGLRLQISLLTYNIAEILIVAYHGVFDSSSMILAARSTTRAISIEIICLLLREIEDKKDSDFVLFAKIYLV